MFHSTAKESKMVENDELLNYNTQMQKMNI